MRVASNLVARRLLRRTTHGYALGPELSRLGEVATLQRDFDRYVPVLQELHAAHGGVAWLIAGREAVEMHRVGMVCDTGFAATARSAWPTQGSAGTLINTAGAHLVLAQRPDLLERISRTGMAPMTPNSLRDAKQLSARVHRARQEGVAVESEQSLEGWSCAAALLPTATAKLAVIGVTVPVVRANSRQILRSLIRAFDAITADAGPLSRPTTNPHNK